MGWKEERRKRDECSRDELWFLFQQLEFSFIKDSGH